MNFFLLANNNNFDWSEISNRNTDTDILVLFNFLLPLNNSYILSYPNKICVSRKRPIKHRQVSTIDSSIREFYCNMGQIKKYESLFNKVYFIPCPHNLENDSQDYEQNIDIFEYSKEKIECIPYNLHETRKELNYPGVGIQYEVSTGIIAYNYFKKLNEINKVILVGFTSELSRFHECEWEKNYFLNEIHSTRCFAIDSYGITNFD